MRDDRIPSTCPQMSPLWPLYELKITQFIEIPSTCPQMRGKHVRKIVMIHSGHVFNFYRKQQASAQVSHRIVLVLFLGILVTVTCIQSLCPQ